METYVVKRPTYHGAVTVSVPGSKSITNRALMLAALSSGDCRLKGVLFSDDSRAFLSCLNALGFALTIDEAQKCVTVHGTGGAIPRRTAEIDVRSAGTAARFLTVMLAFAGGEYTLRSSEQMEKRPMEPLLSELRRAGVKINCLKNEGCFPFTLSSQGVNIKEISIDTGVSSQFASAMLMSGTLLKEGVTIHLTGNRTNGAYILITQTMLGQFGIRFERVGDSYTIFPHQRYTLSEYQIEPDFSAAGYFFAAGALLGQPTTVTSLTEDAMQGDKKFLSVLQRMGATVSYSPQGVTVSGNGQLRGVEVDMNDFSDQALTLAAIAPFASSPTHIYGVEHIRSQECDRLHAMAKNLTAMGVTVREEEGGIYIAPCKEFTPCTIDTFHDHRVAMSFAIAGLKCGSLTIEDPMCCKKTFENFFTILDKTYYV